MLQFHVVYDELFSTILSIPPDKETANQEWIHLFTKAQDSTLPEKDEFCEEDFKFPELDDEWTTKMNLTFDVSADREGRKESRMSK